MKRVMGAFAIGLGVALLSWVAIAMAIEHPIVHERTPLKPILFSFVLLSSGIGWMSHDNDEAEAEA